MGEERDPRLKDLKTGLKERLEEQAVHERLASSTALSQTFESPWWEHDKPDMLEVSLKEGDRQTTAEDLRDTYKAVEGMISDALEKADEEGKRLLIVTGGQHYDRTSMLATALVVEAAVQNGVTQLFDEEAGKDIESLKDLIRNPDVLETKKAEFKSKNIDNNEMYIVEDVMKNNPDVAIAGVDNLLAQESKARDEGTSTPYSRFQEREDAMLGEIDGQLQKHGVLMAGGAHLQGLLESDKKPDDVEVLAFNTTHKAFVFNDEAKENPLTQMEDNRENYSRGQGVREDKVTMLIIPGEGVNTPEAALKALDIVREMDRDEGKWGDKVKASQDKFDKKQSTLKRGLEYVARYSGGAMPYPLEKDDKGQTR